VHNELDDCSDTPPGPLLLYPVYFPCPLAVTKMGKSNSNRKRKRVHAPVSSFPYNVERSGSSASACADWMLLLPSSRVTKGLSSHEKTLLVSQLLDRLEDSGYRKVALAHKIFGSPRRGADDDQADTAIPKSLFQINSQTKGSRRKKPRGLEVYRRLHVVAENLSDVGLYTVRKTARPGHLVSQQGKEEEIQELIDGYDLVSMAPTNDATFQAACSSATAVDIITLDYSVGRAGVQLPFKIRTLDVKNATERGAVFEIPYAPAILNRNQRKGLIQTCRELQTASIGLKPRIILSSGDRTFLASDSDAGAAALRLPGDLGNMMRAVLRFDSKTASCAISLAGDMALDHARKRRFGAVAVVSVSICNREKQFTRSKSPQGNRDRPDQESKSKGKSAKTLYQTGHEPAETIATDLGNLEDGFISFS